MNLVLQRKITANGAVVGTLTGLSKPLYTLEDAWNNNTPGNSCIPTGHYAATPHGWEPNSPVKMKQVWGLQNVPGRSAVLIHAGNVPADTEGCILVGLVLMVSQLQSSVQDSRNAIELMRREIGNRSFTITIA